MNCKEISLLPYPLWKWFIFHAALAVSLDEIIYTFGHYGVNMAGVLKSQPTYKIDRALARNAILKCLKLTRFAYGGISSGSMR